jgi:beta-lactamase class A
LETSRRSRVRILVLIIAAVVIAAAVAAWTLRTERPALTWQALRNASYPVSIVPGGAPLRDGTFEAEAAPGSASRIVVRLADVGAFGDLDSDADPDAVVVLTSSGGGSGTFVELAAVRDENGVARPAAATLLGDRVLVREVRIEARQIFVRIRVRGATDPLTLLTREIARRYTLDGDQLTLLDETEGEVRSTPAEEYVYQPERIDVAVGASRTVGGSLVPGGIASYLMQGNAGETLELEVRSEFDNAVLSISGLSDGETLLSRSNYRARGTLTLPGDQDYVARVVSLAGYPLPYTLEVRRRAATQTIAPTVRPPVAPPSRTTPSPPPAPPAATRPVERPLGRASEAAESFARSRPPTWGVAVFVPARGIVYAENADVQAPTASVVKVLVLLVVLEQARQEGRPAAEDELALLWPMITESDNDATSQLWERIGRGQAVSGYLASIGVTGFRPDPKTSWGVSFVSARAMATILGKLLAGEILDPPSRALAIRMLDSVVPQQRWGVSAGTSAAAGDRVGLKNGWYPGNEGWRVNSAGVVRPRTGDSYAIAIVTGGRETWREGIDTIEGIAAPMNEALRDVR